MVKFYLALFTLLVGTMSFGQATTLLFEDFEGAFPSGWTLVNNDGLTPDSNVSFVNDAWVITADLDDPGSGDSVITSTSWYSPAGTSDDWLISPAITLGGFGNKMSFKAKSYDGSFPDGFQLFASQFNVIDSFLVHDTLLNVLAESPMWTDYQIALDSFGLSGQTIYLAFRNNSDDDYLLSLDSIYVGKEHPVSVTQNDQLVVEVFPNPVSSTLSVSFFSPGARFDILSIDGRLLKSAFTNQIDVSDLNSGSYLLRISSDYGYGVRRFEKY